MKLVHGMAIAIVVAAIGCKGPIGPQIVDVAGIVLADLEAGDGEAKIASDVCHALGGSSTTDAVCADVSTIVADIVANLIAKGKLSPAGETRARLILASMRPVVGDHP